MKTLVGLFLSSAAFGCVISIILWFSSHDRGSTLLLGFMCIALAWAGGYAFFAERNASLEGDDPNLLHSEAAGEDVGIYTTQSAWPICLAFSILVFLVGLIWSDFLLLTGLAAMVLCLWRLGAESARSGRQRIVTKEGPTDVT